MKKGLIIGFSVLILVISILAGGVFIEKSINSKQLETVEVSVHNEVDTTPPVITLKGNKEITIKAKDEYKEEGYTAVDDVDGSIVDRVNVSKQIIDDNKYKIIYNVSDKAGNNSQEERIITREKEFKQANKTETKKDTANNTASKETTNKEIKSNTKSKDNKNTNSTTTSQNKNTINKKTTTVAKKNTDKKNSSTKTKTSTTKNTNTNTKTTSNTTNATKKDTNNSTKAATSSSNNTGVIYLTFDDGPSISSTPKILDILKKNSVKATFFILNYTSGTEYLVKREANEGHSIGIHGYSHDYKKIYKSEAAYMENLNKLQAKIYKSTGIKPTITRFPGGSSNTVSRFNKGIMTRLSKLVVQKGYTYFDWNVDSNDAGGARNSDAVYKNVTQGLRKNRSNVVLMHDFSGNKKTIDALDKIIKYGKKNGYTFKKITSETPMIRHSVNN